MGFAEVFSRRCVGLLAAAALVSACGSADSKRRAVRERPEGGPDAGVDAGPDSAPAPDSSAPPGPLRYIGSTGPAGGTFMKGGGYVLFSVTGEVPGSSGLTKSPGYRMVGGVVGRAH